MARPENPGSQGHQGQDPGGASQSGQSGAAHERNDARQAERQQRKTDRQAYRDQWRQDNPGQEFPGFPPELGGDDADDEMTPDQEPVNPAPESPQP